MYVFERIYIKTEPNMTLVAATNLKVNVILQFFYVLAGVPIFVNTEHNKKQFKLQLFAFATKCIAIVKQTVHVSLTKRSPKTKMYSLNRFSVQRVIKTL